MEILGTSLLFGACVSAIWWELNVAPPDRLFVLIAFLFEVLGFLMMVRYENTNFHHRRKLKADRIKWALVDKFGDKLPSAVGLNTPTALSSHRVNY
jgi:hypothetical protein